MYAHRKTLRPQIARESWGETRALYANKRRISTEKFRRGAKIVEAIGLVSARREPGCIHRALVEVGCRRARQQGPVPRRAVRRDRRAAPRSDHRRSRARPLRLRARRDPGGRGPEAVDREDRSLQGRLLPARSEAGLRGGLSEARHREARDGRVDDRDARTPSVRRSATRAPSSAARRSCSPATSATASISTPPSTAAGTTGRSRTRRPIASSCATSPRSATRCAPSSSTRTRSIRRAARRR